MKLNQIMNILTKIRADVPETEDPDLAMVIGQPEPLKPAFEIMSLALGQGPDLMEPDKKKYQILLVAKDPNKEIVMPPEKKLILPGGLQ